MWGFCLSWFCGLFSRSVITHSIVHRVLLDFFTFADEKSRAVSTTFLVFTVFVHFSAILNHYSSRALVFATNSISFCSGAATCGKAFWLVWCYSLSSLKMIWSSFLATGNDWNHPRDCSSDPAHSWRNTGCPALRVAWNCQGTLLFHCFFYFSAKLNARKWTLFRNFINTAFQMDHSTFSKRVMSLLNIQVVVSLIPRLQSDFSSCRLRVVDRWLVRKDTRKTSMTSSL